MQSYGPFLIRWGWRWLEFLFCRCSGSRLSMPAVVKGRGFDSLGGRLWDWGLGGVRELEGAGGMHSGQAGRTSCASVLAWGPGCAVPVRGLTLCWHGVQAVLCLRAGLRWWWHQGAPRRQAATWVLQLRVLVVLLRTCVP